MEQVADYLNRTADPADLLRRREEGGLHPMDPELDEYYEEVGALLENQGRPAREEP
jgi:hypothetical protein